MNKITFKSRKEAAKFLKTKGIDTSNWSEERWQSINKSQADIHIQAIAELMWDAYNESTPKQLDAGEWHIPFGDTLINHVEEDGLHADSKIDLAGGWIGLFPDIDNLEDIPYDYEYDNWLQQQKIKIATARCARLSYETLGDEPKIDYKADIKLHDILLQSQHMSPFEHCAKVMTDYEYETFIKGNIHLDSQGSLVQTSNDCFGWCNNFRGFIQYRYMVENYNC